jgi:hypothetical protein
VPAEKGGRRRTHQAPRPRAVVTERTDLSLVAQG